MTLQREKLTELEEHREEPEVPSWRSGLELTMWIVGGIALFLGLFISFGPDDQWLGIGDWAWEVGEIGTEWQYGFLVGGAVLLLTVIGMVVARRRR